MKRVTEDDKCIICGPKPLRPLPRTSLGNLIYCNLISNPNQHEALVDAETGKSISYSELLDKSYSLAGSLLKCGYGRNTVIALCSENNLEFFVPILAALYVGAIITTINSNYTPLELRHTLNIAKPQIVFCSKAASKKLIDLRASHVRSIEHVLVIDSEDALGGSELCSDFTNRNQYKSEDNNSLVVKLNPDEQTAFILFSSGTTGLPKGVMLTHTNLLARFMHCLDPRYEVLNSSDIILGLSPFFHAYGLITNLVSIALNQKIVVLKTFDERIFLRTIERYRITRLSVAPPLLVFLAKSPLVDEYDFSSLTEIVCGAAPLSRATEETVMKRLKLKRLRQGYGLTEATLAVVKMPVDERKSGSSGKVMSYMDCKVREPESGRSLGPGLVGELCFKGPMLMKGYYGDEMATRNSFTNDGWLLTGDLGYYDNGGFFYIVDRLKELIKYKGYQVAPAELEALLLTNPKIIDAGVVGVPNDEAGELPLAFVVKNPAHTLTAQEVEQFVAERVSSQKKLRGGVIFVTEIPKNPSGKILRRQLKELLKTLNSKL